MIRTFFTAIFALFMLSGEALAEVTAEDRKLIDGKVDTFFREVNAGRTAEGYAGLVIPRMMETPAVLTNLIDQTEKAAVYAGRPLKWQMVEEKVQGDLIVYRVYIVHSADLPTRFRFIFFRTDKGWAAQSVFFKDINVTDFE